MVDSSYFETVSCEEYSEIYFELEGFSEDD